MCIRDRGSGEPGGGSTRAPHVRRMYSGPFVARAVLLARVSGLMFLRACAFDGFLLAYAFLIITSLCNNQVKQQLGPAHNIR